MSDKASAESSSTLDSASPLRSENPLGQGTQGTRRSLSVVPGTRQGRGQCRRRGCGNGIGSRSTGVQIDCMDTTQDDERCISGQQQVRNEQRT